MYLGRRECAGKDLQGWGCECELLYSLYRWVIQDDGKVEAP